LKRARDESVLDLPKRPEPAARDWRRAIRQPPAAVADPATLGETRVLQLRGWSGYAVLATLTVTVLAIGYLSGRGSDASETPVAAAASPRAVPLPALAPAEPSRPAPPTTPPGPALQETVRVEISPTPSVATPQELAAKAPQPALGPAKEPAVRPGGSPPPVESEAMSAFGHAAELTRSARVATAPLGPVARVPHEPDRWGILTDSLSRCGREAFFSRPSCEQRARTQHCAGFWGQTPHCPNPAQYEHSR